MAVKALFDTNVLVYTIATEHDAYRTWNRARLGGGRFSALIPTRIKIFFRCPERRIETPVRVSVFA
jgi:hypothetical protein